MGCKSTTLGEFIDASGGSIQTGPFGTKLKASEYTPTGVPVISVGEVGYGRIRLHDRTPKVDETVWNRMPEYLLEKDDIVFGRKGAVDRSAQIQPNESGYFLGSDGIRVRLDPNHCYPKFIAYQLQEPAHKEWMIQHAAGTTMPSLNEGIIRRIPIVLPPLPEQKAVAHILGSLDDKIELNRQMNATLEAMAQALFKSWFVDFDPVIDNALAAGNPIPEELADRAQLRREALANGTANREAATKFPESFDLHKILGTIPSGWRVQPLGDYLDILETGRRPKGGVAKYSFGIPSVGAESINGIGVFDYGKTKYVPEDFFEKMNSGKVQSHDVLLYKDGGKPGEFKPRIGMLGNGYPFEIYGINEHVFRMRSEKLGQPFLYFQVGSERVFHHLAVRGGKAAIPGINQTEVRSVDFLIPSSEIVRQFNKLTSPKIDKILENAVVSQTLTKLRDTLLPKLISGELRIPEAEKLAEQANA